MIKAVDHVCFTVADRDRSVEFYKTLFGAEPLAVGEDASTAAAHVIGYPRTVLRFAYFQLPGANSVLELFEYVEPAARPVDMETYNVGNGHLGLTVDDLEAEYERLLAAGATFRHPGPVSVDAGDWEGTKALYMRDPDGITIELMESPPPFSVRFA